MSLENDIRDQYSKRINTEALYNSEYSRLADEERERRFKAVIAKHLPEPESILEVGAGQGDNVPILKACGFSKIVLNELLPDRIESARKKFPELKIYAGNAIDINITEKFDCVFQSTVFTSVLKDKDRKMLAKKMWQLVKPGGIILWYDFIYNNPNNPAVRKVAIAELKELFPAAVTSHIEKITLAPPLGRRVGKLYRLFNMPFLRSHILAVFHKE